MRPTNRKKDGHPVKGVLCNEKKGGTGAICRQRQEQIEGLSCQLAEAILLQN